MILWAVEGRRWSVGFVSGVAHIERDAHANWSFEELSCRGNAWADAVVGSFSFLGRGVLCVPGDGKEFG